MSPQGPGPQEGDGRATSGKAGKRKQSLEECLQALERTAARLEAGNVTLDETLEALEQGIALHRQCIERLQAAHTKIRQIEAQAPLPHPGPCGDPTASGESEESEMPY